MIVVYILLGILGAFLAFYLIPTLFVSNVIYTVLLVRTSKKKWSRTCSWDNADQQKMFDDGEEWGKENEQFRKRVEIKSGRFRLVGEYFDFGNKKAVIVIPGRMESGVYSYYFSEPYKRSGYNVLAIDNRSHGLSSGRYNTLGLKEYRDILQWGKFLHEEFAVESIVIHGICIGSATALYALTDPDCPDYMRALVADGMYTDFGETLKNHFIEKKKPLFPFIGQVLWMISAVAGRNILKNSPINCIGKLQKPILLIYSKQDIYSTPDQAQLLYQTANEPKKLVMFEKGIHSHVRINAVEQYDQTVMEFLKTL